MKGATGLIIVVAVFVGVALLGGSGKGIHPIGSQAVYLAGESCTVNTRQEIREMKADMEECLRLHVTLVELLEGSVKRVTGELYTSRRCFVPMGTNRPLMEISADMEECLRLHQSAFSSGK